MTELELLRKEYDQLNSRHNLLLERLARHFSNPIWHVESLGLSSDDIVKAGLYNEDGLYGMFPFQTSDPKPSSTQHAPSVPAGWLPVPEKHPTFDPVDLRLSDGSVLCGCIPQLDGDYWWEGPSGEVFIDPRYAPVTHWRLSATPEAKP